VLRSQAEYLYAGGRAQRAVEQLSQEGWLVVPNMYLTFRNDRGPGHIWLNVTLPLEDYIARLAGPDSDLPYQHERSEFEHDLWPRLVVDGYATGASDEERDLFIERLGNRQNFYLRSALATYYHWPYGEAVKMDSHHELVPAVRDRIAELLAALDEPRLPGTAA
jgi:hypothetical protein